MTRRERVIKVENTTCTVCGSDSVICFALLWSLGKSCYLLYFYKETSGSVTVWLTFDPATFSFCRQRHMLAAVFTHDQLKFKGANAQVGHHTHVNIKMGIVHFLGRKSPFLLLCKTTTSAQSITRSVSQILCSNSSADDFFRRNPNSSRRIAQ